MTFGSRMRTRLITMASMSNENEIGNDGADQLWVENDGADDLGGASRVGRDLGSGFVGVEGSSLSLSLCASDPEMV